MERPEPDIGVDGVEDRLREDRPRVLTTTRAGRKELGGQLAGLSMPRQVYILAIWPFLEQLLSFGVGFVDAVLAGHLSVEAANALGVATYMGWLVKVLQMAVGIGGTALVARAIGGRHRRLANAALGQSLVMGVAAGLFMGLVVILIAPAITRWLNMDAESARLCVLYLRIENLSAPLSALMLVASACLRGAGDTRSPFQVIVLINIVNTVMSVLLVYGPGRIGGHGVAGIAAGTVIAWVVGAGAIIVVLLRGRGGLRLHLHRLRVHWATMRRISAVATPSLFESLGMWSGNFLVVKIVGALPAIGALGAHVVAIRIEAISYMPGLALGTAAATLAGQYLGLGDPRRAMQAVRWCWGIGAIVTTTMGMVFILFPEFLVRIVTDQAPLLEATPPLLRICGPVEVFFGTYVVLSQALRGAGDTRYAMVMMYLSTFLVRLPLAYVLGIVMGMGLTGVWLGLCAELVVRGVIFAARFLHGGWVRARV